MDVWDTRLQICPLYIWFPGFGGLIQGQIYSPGIEWDVVLMFLCVAQVRLFFDTSIPRSQAFMMPTTGVTLSKGSTAGTPSDLRRISGFSIQTTKVKPY